MVGSAVFALTLGAEAEWYEEWEKENGLDGEEFMEYRRRPRNGPIPDVHELENVRGFREYPAILTGGALNPWDEGRGELIRVKGKGILEVLCADGPQKINVNSCKNPGVLLTIPGIYNIDDAEDDKTAQQQSARQQRRHHGQAPHRSRRRAK